MLFFRLPVFFFALPLFLVPLGAQEVAVEDGLVELDPNDAGVLPDGSVPPPVDLIRPVPAPEIPLVDVDTSPTLPENLQINNQGGSIEGNLEDGIRLGGPIHVKGDNGLEIFSNRAEVDLRKKTVLFLGNVSVYQGKIFQRGDRAVYHYEDRKLDASTLRISLDPILLEAGKFTGQSIDGEYIFVGENAGVTTHDVEHPNFWVRSDVTTVYPGDRVTFKNLKLYAGDTPVFWLPYLSQPLDSELGYHFLPGGRSNWGPYLLNTYGIMLGGTRNKFTGENEDAWLLSQWRFDLRGKRGAAVGLNLIDKREEYSKEITGLSLYYLHDLDPLQSRTGRPRSSVNANRYQVQLKHRYLFDFEKEADWRLDTNLTLLSDQYYLEDFERSVYRTSPVPDNTIGLYRRGESSLLSLIGDLSVNDFYRESTKLPEIAYDQVRRPLFGLPVLHEGQTSFSIRGVEAAAVTRRDILNPLFALPVGDPREGELLARLNSYERGLVRQIRNLPPGSARADALRAQLFDTGFNRFHTNHAFSLPMRYGDWLTVTPRFGGAFTDYSSVKGPIGSDSRVMLHTGAEAAVKLSKNYGPKKNHGLGLDGLLHVVQPYLNWSILEVDELDRDYPKIDRLTFTTRPRPLDPSRYTAIDEFNSWNIFRLGVRNDLMTRRDDQSHRWLHVDTYMDHYFDDPEGGRSWSNLYNDIRWQPLPWLGLDLDTQIPVLSGGAGFSELSTRLRLQPHENVRLALAYRHLNSHPVLLDSNRFNLDTYVRLSENWGVGSRHIFEMSDGTLEVQQYTVHRDLGNWTAGVGLTHRDNRYKDEYGIMFSLTLKDFPSVTLPFTLDAE